MNPEEQRLKEARDNKIPWKKWGPYLSERQWGTVREDYSENGDAWNFFTHDQARSRAYRWGEDGLGGISDDKQRLCFALALWNGKDPILKERLFGLTNSEGNHGEDVKEYYFYLDSTPTHSYMKYLYKYPQAAFPYADLVETNRRRSREEMEYELLDTGVFDDDRYFDVFVEYAKAGPEDLLMRITARQPGAGGGRTAPACRPSGSATTGPRGWPGPPPSRCSGRSRDRPARKRSSRSIRCWGPVICIAKAKSRCSLPRTKPTTPGSAWTTRMRARTSKTASTTTWCRDRQDTVNPDRTGTKAAAHYRLKIGPGQSATVRLRLTDQTPAGQDAADPFGPDFDQTPGRPAAGGGRVLPFRDPALGLPGCRQCNAPGPRRHALVQAVLLPGRRSLAGGTPGPPPPSRDAVTSGTGSGST